jgi:prevent-host-death family protein
VSISVSDARAALPSIIERVLGGEEVTLTRHGEAVAVMVRPDRLRARRSTAVLTAAERVGELIAAGRDEALGAGPRISASRADELIAAVRAGRSGR